MAKPEISNTPAIMVDDHPIFRDGLSRLVAERLQLNVLEAGDMAGLRELLDQYPEPELLILDVLFPGFDVATQLQGLRQELATTAIVVVSMVEDEEVIDTIMADGVNGFVTKSASPDTMVSAIGDVLAGQIVEYRPEIQNSQPATPTATAIEQLSTRQREVLTLICHGMSNKEIAKELGLSPFTVRIHVSALLRSLGVSTRTEAAAIAGNTLR